MPAMNSNVWERMNARGVDWSDPRVMRRYGNRSFQANQGTLAKGNWTNKDQMRSQWQYSQDNPRPTQGSPQGSSGGGGGASNSEGKPFRTAAQAVPKWKQQRQNAERYGSGRGGGRRGGGEAAQRQGGGNMFAGPPDPEAAALANILGGKNTMGGKQEA